LVRECEFTKLASITREAIGKWLEDAENAGMAAGTRNEYLTSLVAFCNWMVREDRLPANPLAGVQKADRHTDRRHQRRALSAEEVGRLLAAARLRPVAELGRESVPLPEADRRGRSGWTYEPLTAENLQSCHTRGLKKLTGQDGKRRALQRRGRQRALFYLLAVSTGLRRKELASLTVGQVRLDAVPGPYVELLGKDSKNGRSAHIPLRQDVVNELRAFLADLGDDLPLERKLFHPIPTIRVFDADIRAAGIAKRDQRGRVVDIHALRCTFGTHLSVAGVRPRTAMAAMRHGRIDLTMNYYTDPVLLDVAAAVNSLPDFQRGADSRVAVVRPTGTD